MLRMTHCLLIALSTISVTLAHANRAAVPCFEVRRVGLR